MQKIDLIIENIEYAKLVKEQAHIDELLDEALAAARELQALKPVGIRYNYFGTVVNPYNDGLFNRLEKYPDIELQKLYALDEVTK
jgi:hypothetical protein